MLTSIDSLTRYLGDGWIRFSLTEAGNETTHTFKIQEFRRPEYEVSSTTRPSALHYAHPINDEYVIVTSQGKLFAGGYLTDAQVQWTVQAETTTFTPAKRSDYIFGRARSFFCWFGNDNRSEITYPEKRFQVSESSVKERFLSTSLRRLAGQDG